MSFSAVGSVVDVTSTSTTLNPAGINDLFLIQVIAEQSTTYCTAVSGGGCVWRPLTQLFTGTETAYTVTTFIGKVITAGSSTMTLSWSNGTPTTIRGIAQEFSSTVGGWTLDTYADLDADATGWSSMTPAVSGELYWGFAREAGDTTNGSTSGYTYGSDGAANGWLYDADCTSAAQAPTFGNTDQRVGQAVLLREVPWTVLQSAVPSSHSSGTVAATMGSGVSSGTKLIAYLQVSDGDSGVNPSCSGISDGNGNSFTLLKDVQSQGTIGSTYYQHAQVWVLDTPAGDAGTAPTITATLSGSANVYGDLLVQEVYGLLAGTSCLDGTAGSLAGSDTASYTTGSPTYTSSEADEYLVSMYEDNGGSEDPRPTWTAPANYVTDANSINGELYGDVAVAYAPSAGAAELGDWSVTNSSFDVWATILVAFKLAPTSGITYNTGTAAFADGSSSVKLTIPGTNSIYSLYDQVPTATLQSDTNPYTNAVEFSVTSDCDLSAIWFYSASGATVLPTEIALFDVTSQTLIHSETASWSGAVGSGWIKASFASPPSLTANTNYKGALFCPGGGNWYSYTDSYYTSGGPGANGVTNGPIFAPNTANASPGQCSYATGGSLAYPDDGDSGGNNWTDVEVTQTIGVNVGDVMLLNVQINNQVSTAPNLSFSGGGGNWSLVPMTDGSANPQSGDNAGYYSYGFAYYRVATMADVGATVTITDSGANSGTDDWTIALASYTGANQLNPIDRAGGATGVEVSSLTLPSETARIEGDWAVYLCGAASDVGLTVSGPTGATQRQSVQDPEDNVSAIYDSGASIGLSAASGTFTVVVGQDNTLNGFTICLAPAGIYVVQTLNTGTWSGNTFSNNATTGNTVFLFPVAYAVPADTTSYSPTYNNASVPGSSQVWSTQSNSGSGTDMYSACWMLPNVPTSSEGVGITVSAGSEPSPLCAFMALEVLGLGSNPIVDQAQTANGSSGNSVIGPTGATQSTNELVLASGAIYGSYPSDGPGAPWTNLTDPTNQHGIVSWQTASSSGETYTWSEDGNGSPWAGGIATIHVPDWSIDASTPAAVTAASGNPSTVTSGAFSPPGGSVIACLVSSGDTDSSSPLLYYDISDNSGGKLAWTIRSQTPAQTGVHDAFAQVITTTVPAGGLTGLTVTATQASGEGYGGGPIALLPLVVNGVQESGGAMIGTDISNSNPAEVPFTPKYLGSLPVFAVQAGGSVSQLIQSPLNAFEGYISGSGWTMVQGYYAGTATKGSAITMGSSSSISNQAGYVAVYELPLIGSPTPGSSGFFMIGIA